MRKSKMSSKYSIEMLMGEKLKINRIIIFSVLLIIVIKVLLLLNDILINTDSSPEQS